MLQLISTNLKINSEYDGLVTLVIGDGSHVPIKQTGSTSLLSSNKVFKLDEVLYVPRARSNLI